MIYTNYQYHRVNYIDENVHENFSDFFSAYPCNNYFTNFFFRNYRTEIGLKTAS